MVYGLREIFICVYVHLISSPKTSGSSSSIILARLAQRACTYLVLVYGVPAAGHGVPGADDEVLDGDAEARDEFEAVVVLGGVHRALQDGLAAVHEAEHARHLRDGDVGTEQRAEAAAATARGGGGIGGRGKVVEVVENLAEEVGRGGGQDEAVRHQGAVGADDLHVGEPSAKGT